MNLINEMINPNTINLSDVQLYTLLSIKTSQTPKLGYEVSDKNEKTIAARTALRLLGLVLVGFNQAQVSNSGIKLLINYNLIDDSNQLTQSGEDLIKNFTIY